MNLAAALDFGTSKIAMVSGNLDSNGKLQVNGSAMAGYAGFHENEWLDWEGLKDAVVTVRREVSHKAGKRVGDVVVAVPGEFIKVFFERVDIELDSRVTEMNLTQIQRSQSQNSMLQEFVTIHRIPVSFLLDGAPRAHFPLGERGRMLSCYVSHIIAERSFLDGVENLLDGLGIGVTGYVASALSTGQYVKDSTDGKRTVVVIDAGNFSTDVIVVEGDGLVFHNRLFEGGANITGDLARTLNLDYEQAELLKKQRPVSLMTEFLQNGYETGIIQDIIESRVRSISRKSALELDRLGLVWNSQTDIFITGGALALLRGARDIVSSEMGTVVKNFIPDQPMITSPMYTTSAAALYYSLKVSAREPRKGIKDWMRELFGN